MMARQAPGLFLEDWLRNSVVNNINNSSSRHAANSSAQVIIQAWAELRDCLQQSAFHSRHLNSLKNLVGSRASLYVADPQAKLLVSILSSPNISLPNDAYPLFFRLLNIWVRKSSKPSLSLIDLAMDVVTRLFNNHFNAKKSASLFTEGALFTGALSCVPSLSKNTKTDCVSLLCKMLEEQYQCVCPVGGLSPDVLAGIGYALSSCEDGYFVRLLNFVLGNWSKVEMHHDIPHALLVLHLIEWVMFGLLSAGAVEKIKIFSTEVLENLKASYATFAVLMATAGALRALNRPLKNGAMLDIVSRLKTSAETRMEVIASDLTVKIRANSDNDNENSEANFLLHCLSLVAARSGGLNTAAGPLLICLAFALLTEVFPLRKFYTQILKSPVGDSESVNSVFAKKHQDDILFKEAGATTGVFCNLYSSATENDKCKVEDLVWDFCHETYNGHRRVAFLLRGSSDQLLGDLEKIAESAFLMVVVFALAVTKHRLISKFSREIQIDISVKVLVSFSCMEHFRRIRLPEYTEAIRSVAACVQDNESVCVSFVESLPSYGDLTNPHELHCLQNDNYIWSKDEVQTSRIMFYLRVIPTSVSRLPADVFRRVVAATMFLYMGHPNVKVARASHSVFLSFVSSEKEADKDERTILKEQLVFYYVKRSLEEYPKITPFDGLASGVSALVRHLPAGSPSIYYCVHSLTEKANELCREAMTLEGNDWWKNWQGDSEPCKKILELLFLLISMVDIQVLSELMKLLAQLIVQLPKDGQHMVLSDLYALVAESDDVTRKQSLVSWLQSLSFLCSQPTATKEVSTEERDGENISRATGSLSLQNVVARL
ncbi:hypothetical protein RND81_08G121600 [Saponaria officinalis]|uniref:Uncharacterized protein n=1 Tax=Saponaria officinalis TaxID=3572 RepID=A0AAW1J7V7_SAPOF